MLEMQICRIEWTVAASEVTTVTEISPPCKILKYEPRAPRVKTTRTRGTGVGSWPVGHVVENVRETITLSVKDDAPGWLRTLNGAVEGGQAWAEGMRLGMRMVIRVRDTQRHDADEWFEARLYGGAAKLASSGGRVIEWTIEREPYWHGDEVQLQVMNESGTSWAWASSAPVYNCFDSSHDNWVLVEAPDGDVPTPARIRITNTYNNVARLREVRIGWSDQPHLLQLEGEDADGGPPTQVSASYSNGERGYDDEFIWTVSNVGVDYVGMFRVLANGSMQPNADWSLSVGYVLTRLQQLDAVDGDSGWTDLGVVTLPPGRYTHPTRYAMKVWLEEATTIVGYLDYVVFLPIKQYRKLTFAGYNALYNTSLEDDGIRDELIYDVGGLRLSIIDAWGFPIELWPEDMLPQGLSGSTPPNAQMLAFTLQNDTGGAEALRSVSVQVWARPRYSVLP